MVRRISFMNSTNHHNLDATTIKQYIATHPPQTCIKGNVHMWMYHHSPLQYPHDRSEITQKQTSMIDLFGIEFTSMST